MQIAKSKGVEDIGHIENKIREMGKELSVVRHRDEIATSQLQTENELLRRQLKEKETQLACMLASPWRHCNVEH